MYKACFFDRDGVLVEEANYLKDPDLVHLCPGAPEAIRRMRDAGFKIVVVSNQSGIARGYFTPDDLKAVEARMNALLKAEHAEVDASYYCFHHPKGSVPQYAVACDCRKPAPGMLLRAAAEMDLNLSESYMIGDKTDDVRAGQNAGCYAAALVRTGHGNEQKLDGFTGKIADEPDVLSAVMALLRKFPV